MEIQRKFAIVLTFGLMAAFSMACAAAARTEISTNTPDPLTRQTESVKSQTSPVETTSPAPNPPSDAVLKACSSEEQKKAMRPGEQIEIQNLDICYDLTLSIGDEGKQYSGTARITFTNQTGLDLSELYFRTYPNANVIYGGELTVSSASVDGQPVTPEVQLQDKTSLRIPLSTPLEKGQTTTVQLEFTGRPPVDMPQAMAYGIFNLNSKSNVLTMANWYPILAELDQGQWENQPVTGIGDAVVSSIGLYRVKITAPDGWMIASSGTNIDTSGGFTAVTGPVRDFIVVASPSFKPQEQVVEGIIVNHWAIAGISDSSQVALTTANASLQIYNQDFGAYPYNEMDIVDVPLKNASGVEYPGLILIESDLYTNSGADNYLQMVIAHEIGHQWWYGVVGNDVLENPWMDEGLTTYTSLLYFEQKDPGYYRGALDSFQDAANTHPKAGISEPVTKFSNDQSAYSDVVYLKTAVFFSQLRKQIGDKAFFDALKDYYTQNKYQIASPDDLLSSFERSCNCNLDELYSKFGARAN